MMTASWLRQMGWQDVFVLAEAGSETGRARTPILGSAGPAGAADRVRRACPSAGNRCGDHRRPSLSRDYRKAHIPGAWFAIRSRLARR